VHKNSIVLSSQLSRDRMTAQKMLNTHVKGTKSLTQNSGVMSASKHSKQISSKLNSRPIQSNYSTIDSQQSQIRTRSTSQNNDLSRSLVHVQVQEFKRSQKSGQPLQVGQQKKNRH